MSYESTEWKDRVVENPRTYTAKTNDDGTITLTPAPGTVTNAGTPVNAKNLNKMEAGIQAAYDGENVVVFEEAEEQEEILPTDTVKTVFGKLKKYFSNMRSFVFKDLAQSTEVTDEDRAVSAAAFSALNTDFLQKLGTIYKIKNVTYNGTISMATNTAIHCTEYLPLPTPPDGYTRILYMYRAGGNILVFPNGVNGEWMSNANPSTITITLSLFILYVRDF